MNYKKNLCILLIVFGCSIALMDGQSLYAMPIIVTNVGSDDVTGITVDVSNIPGGAKISVDILDTSPPLPPPGGFVIADITGIFFDLVQDVGTGFGVISSITGADISAVAIKEGSIQKINGGGPNMGGSVPKFDAAVQIGTSTGIPGGDDFQDTMISILGAGIDASDITRIGIRLQSVGTAGSSRTGSGKYVGNPSVTPEPMAVILLCTGLMGLAGLRRLTHGVPR